MKMVKFGGKEVPFFAADGKGANDLKKALGGAMVRRRAEMGAKVKEKPYRYMRYGGEVEMAMAQAAHQITNASMKRVVQSKMGTTSRRSLLLAGLTIVAMTHQDVKLAPFS